MFGEVHFGEEGCSGTSAEEGTEQNHQPLCTEAASHSNASQSSDLLPCRWEYQCKCKYKCMEWLHDVDISAAMQGKRSVPVAYLIAHVPIRTHKKGEERRGEFVLKEGVFGSLALSWFPTWHWQLAAGRQLCPLVNTWVKSPPACHRIPEAPSHLLREDNFLSSALACGFLS